MNTTEDAARRFIAPHLWDGEEILWCDLPQAPGAVAAAFARQGFFTTMPAVSGLAVFFLYFGINMIKKDDPWPGIFMLGLGAVIIGVVLSTRTLSAWVRGRHAARGTAYAVTNRRVLIVRGEDVDWAGPKQLEDVVVRGNNVVVTRQRHQLESFWKPDAPGSVDDNAPGQVLFDKANAALREMTLAAVRDPLQVMALVQTLQHLTAS